MTVVKWGQYPKYFQKQKAVRSAWGPWGLNSASVAPSSEEIGPPENHNLQNSNPKRCCLSTPPTALLGVSGEYGNILLYKDYIPLLPTTASKQNYSPSQQSQARGSQESRLWTTPTSFSASRNPQTLSPES